MYLTSVKKSVFNIKEEVRGFFSKGVQRSIEAKKNIVGSFLIKIANMGISLLLVPITINYVNPTQYGVWLTLTSMVAWVALFDVGLTQGLRNKFAEAKALKDSALARTYVSTTYYYVALIFMLIGIVAIAASYFVDWRALINAPLGSENELKYLVVIVISYFCLQFIFQIVKVVITSDQKPALASLIELSGQVLVLLIVWLLTHFTEGSLIYLGLAIGLTPVVVLILANLYFFSGKYQMYRPSLAFVKKEYASELMTMGGKFFVLQLAAMIQYSTTLFLIAHYFDPESVTAYNIAFKYFVSLQAIFMIFLTPLWSSTTDAYFLKDFDWILRVIGKYMLLLIPFAAAALLMLFFSDDVYRLWLGDAYIAIDSKISILCCIYIVVSMFSSVFVNVVNGMGTLKIQFVSSIVTSLFFLVLCYAFINYFGFGVWSIILASILSNVYGFAISPVQVYKVLIEKTSSKIWY
ncbi:lipopolysaccharide biosynthesis protein [Algoriphagus oliviformis]|nr:oligosaccharide flippase family protein [Algoriphagus oliviformis]